MINKKKTLRNVTQLATGYKTGYNCRTDVPIDTVHNDGKKEETPEFFKKHHRSAVGYKTANDCRACATDVYRGRRR